MGIIYINIYTSFSKNIFNESQFHGAKLNAYILCNETTYIIEHIYISCVIFYFYILFNMRCLILQILVATVFI